MEQGQNSQDMAETRYRRLLSALAAAAVAVGMVGIGWGLPQGNHTWAADSVAPMTPPAVAYHVFAEKGFDSGYFYFKYPVGHQLLLAAVSAPVLAGAALSGNLSGIESDYPFGFSDPELYLTAMALASRLVSVLAGTGLLLAVAGIARRIAGRGAALAAALLAAGSYPWMFYLHTSNVELPYLFWAFLALYAAMRSAGEGGRWLWLMGTAAAMALSTKEQIAGFLVLLPPALLALHWRDRRGRPDKALMPEGAATGALLSVAVWLTANAAFFNPSGFINRIRFLTHTLDPEVRELYAGYEFPIDLSSSWALADEAAHMAKTAEAVVSSIGWPAALLGLAGLVWMALKHRRGLLWVAAAGAGYYLVSLRLLKQVEIRYTMALSTLAAVPAGILACYLWRELRRTRILVAAVMLFGLVYSGEVLSLLVNDARYEAERWARPWIERGKSIEVYQSWTYLPRWKHRPEVTRVAFDAIGIEGLGRRTPDLIVISDKGKAGISMYPNPDWRDGRGLMLVDENNRRFLEGLEAGRLGYERLRTFRRPMLFERTLITSLNPTITVYGRSGG